MTGPYLIGIDCGTQSAKVVVYDAHGRTVSEGRRALRPMDRPRPGVALHPDDDIWDSIASASTEAMLRFTGDTTDIVGIGLCPIRCCKAFLRADGSLVEPVISWMDERAYLPYLPADPSLRYATTLSGYISHRFTGECADTAANNIESQWPIDTDTWRWSDDPTAYARHGIPRSMLFELKSPGDIVGCVTPQAATATGIPAGIPVIHTANDKAVEMLGAGSIDDRTALVSLGTYIAAMVHGSVQHRSSHSFWTNFSAIANRYLYETNGIRRGMWTLTWFLDLLGPELADRARSMGLTREELLEREAVDVPAGSEGLMTVLDWLAEADTPFRKGVMLGFDARHTRGHIYRSILEAIAMTMKLHVDAMCTERHATVDELVLSGGGSRSPLFLQIFADVFGLRASRSTGSSGASLGAAMCAAAAVGVYPNIETAVSVMASERETFSPISINTELYRRVIEGVYPNIRPATDALLQRSYQIFH